MTSRRVTAHLSIDVVTPATLVFEIAVAQAYVDLGGVVETWTITRDGAPVPRPREIAAADGARWHVLDAQPGQYVIDYWATVEGTVVSLPAPEVDALRFRRPSRYCESDTLAATARAEFAGLPSQDLLPAVASWVGTHLAYVPGSSGPTDGAVATLLARRGVCRDFAHLVIAMLRGLDVPARLASVYAPGLSPMDFHAVAEAYVDGAWYVVDATTLAPRASLLRIATGSDAADTAFLSVHGGIANLMELEVSAVVDVLPQDDVTQLVQLA